MESETNCDIKSDYPSTMSAQISNRGLITIDKNLFYDLEGGCHTSQVERSELSGKTLETLRNIPILKAQNIEYLPPDVQNCVEINSSDVMNIPENEILQIQYQTENGMVNAEYIVDDQLLQMEIKSNNSNFMEMNQENIFNGNGLPSEVSEKSIQFLISNIFFHEIIASKFIRRNKILKIFSKFLFFSILPFLGGLKCSELY